MNDTNYAMGQLGLEVSKLRRENAELAVALRACLFELVTLNPRLSSQYRKSVEQCIELAKDALAKGQQT